MSSGGGWWSSVAATPASPGYISRCRASNDHEFAAEATGTTGASACSRPDEEIVGFVDGSQYLLGGRVYPVTSVGQLRALRGDLLYKAEGSFDFAHA
jgi:hypothetical protein